MEGSDQIVLAHSGTVIHIDISAVIYVQKLVVAYEVSAFSGLCII